MSLRGRLVLFVTATVLAALLSQGVLGYLNFQRLLYTDLDRDLGLYLADLGAQARALPGPARGETLSFADLELRPSDYLTSARIVHEGRVKETLGRFPAGTPLGPGPVRSVGSWRVGGVRLGNDLYLQGAVASPAPAYSLGRYRQTVVLTTLLVSALGGLAALLLSGPVLRPLRHLRRTARRVADSGDLSLRVPESGVGEIADLSRTFNLMLARLEAFVARETRFVRNASHELRTPLTAMRLHLSAYREGYASADETLTVVTDEVERMTRLSAGLLTLAREGRVQRVGLDVAELARTAAARAGARYAGPARLALTGDPLLLQQALGNLLENAAKHAPGAAVTLILTRATEHARRYAVLSVLDDGPGMTADGLRHAADAFYRAPGTQAPGSGLGLSVALQIAEAHGGRLGLEPNTPSGVRASLWLGLD